MKRKRLPVDYLKAINGGYFVWNKRQLEHPPPPPPPTARQPYHSVSPPKSH